MVEDPNEKRPFTPGLRCFRMGTSSVFAKIPNYRFFSFSLDDANSMEQSRRAIGKGSGMHNDIFLSFFQANRIGRTAPMAHPQSTRRFHFHPVPFLPQLQILSCWPIHFMPLFSPFTI